MEENILSKEKIYWWTFCFEVVCCKNKKNTIRIYVINSRGTVTVTGVPGIL